MALHNSEIYHKCMGTKWEFLISILDMEIPLFLIQAINSTKPILDYYSFNVSEKIHDVILNKSTGERWTF